MALPPLQLLINHQWMFSYGGNIDAWVYFGFFNDLTGHLRTFGHTYYASRLSWILPGAIAYKLFTPIVANYVLHLLFCELALVSLYLTLRWTTRPDVAFVVTAATAGYPFFLWSMGWDYVDGAGIAYYLLAMCVVTYAPRSRWRYLLIALGGAAFACAVHTNIMWLVFMPAIVAYCVFGGPRAVGPSIAAVSMFCAGTLVLTATLAAVNARITGEWWFFAPSFSMTGALTTGNPWKRTGLGWVLGAPWLLLPGGAGVVSIWFVQRVARRKAVPDPVCVFFAIQYLLFVLLLFALEMKGLPLFEAAYYVGYLIPAMALAFGGVLHADRPGGFSINTPLILIAVLLMATVPYSETVHAWAAQVRPAYHVAWPLACMLIGFAALLIRHAIATTIFLTALASAYSLMQHPTVFPKQASGNKDVVFRAVADTLPLIKLCGPSGNTFFWYNRTDRYGHAYNAIASTELWNYRLISDEFPSSVNPVSRSPLVPDVGDRILITSDDAGRWRLAENVLGPLGLSLDPLWSRTIEHGPVRFEATCVRVAAHHGDSEIALPVPAERFGRADGRTPGSAVVIDPRQHAVEVTTNRSTFDWQIVSDVIPVSRGGSYALEFNVNVSQGGMGVTVIDERSTVLATKNWCLPQAEREAEIRFRLESGSGIRIVFSNCALSKPHVSVFSVKDVRIWRSSSD